MSLAVISGVGDKLFDDFYRACNEVAPGVPIRIRETSEGTLYTSTSMNAVLWRGVADFHHDADAYIQLQPGC